MDDAYKASDAIEEAALVRVREIYAAALRAALKRTQTFLRKADAVASGKTPPPDVYVQQGPEAVKRWRQGFMRELIRQEAVIEKIIAVLNEAGVKAEDVIKGSLAEIYQTNRQDSERLLSLAVDTERLDVDMTFSQLTTREIAVILSQNEPPMTKIAWDNIKENPAMVRKLQNELALATALGEGQQKLIRRIEKVTGMAYAQAKRVAQTERTRVQSQARWAAGEEAKAAGVGVYNTWSTRMINSRETHIMLNGKKAMQGDYFPGSVLRYPGDPSAPAREVINCHCVLVPDVLLPGETLDGGGTIVPQTQEENPAIAGIRFVNKLDALHRNAANIEPIEGYEDVVVHADKYSFVFKDGNGVETTVSAREFAKVLKNSPDYHGGSIRLIACEAGMGEAYAAQGLADEIGVDVMAPTGVVLVYPDGEMVVAEKELTNAPDWIIFKPRTR